MTPHEAVHCVFRQYRIFRQYRQVSALRLPFERVEGALSVTVGGSTSRSVALVALVVVDRHDLSGVGKEAKARDAFQARCTLVHVVSNAVHAIEEGVNSLLPVKRQVRRPGSRHHVVDIVHELVDRARKTDSQISALSDAINITHPLDASHGWREVRGVRESRRRCAPGVLRAHALECRVEGARVRRGGVRALGCRGRGGERCGRP
jgi:hypothetical protein